ncbi:MAG TPA: ABC transporter permease [Terriglobales bacterium]|nr:ABC transporter permease [Terriglobales bacterium]
MSRNLGLAEPAVVALQTMRAHKLRSFLMLLGIILSVSTLILVISLIEGTNRYIADRVANLGSNVFLVNRFGIITSAEDFVKAQRRNRIITWEDYEALRDGLKLPKAVGVEVRTQGKVKAGGESLEDIDIRGVTANIGEMDVEEPATGRYISDADNDHRAPVTLIGSEVATRLFPNVDPIGRTLDVDGRPYEVVGVAKSLGSALGQSQDGFVYIPIQTWMKVYGSHRSLTINVQARGAEWIARTQDEARVLMRARRHLRPDEEDNFGIIGSATLMDLWRQLTGVIATSMVGVVSVFLVIGGVVIMNVMLASVTERTREIGIRKSLGARRKDILMQFLVEASVMASFGGFLGVTTAWLLALVVKATTSIPMAVPLAAVIIALGVSTAVGLFFGIYPAHKASKLDPIEALRFEV